MNKGNSQWARVEKKLGKMEECPMANVDRLQGVEGWWLFSVDVVM